MFEALGSVLGSEGGEVAAEGAAEEGAASGAASAAGSAAKSGKLDEGPTPTAPQGAPDSSGAPEEPQMISTSTGDEDEANQGLANQIAGEQKAEEAKTGYAAKSDKLGSGPRSELTKQQGHGGLQAAAVFGGHVGGIIIDALQAKRNQQVAAMRAQAERTAQRGQLYTAQNQDFSHALSAFMSYLPNTNYRGY